MMICPLTLINKPATLGAIVLLITFCNARE
jgi:hypothetical protein